MIKIFRYCRACLHVRTCVFMRVSVRAAISRGTRKCVDIFTRPIFRWNNKKLKPFISAAASKAKFQTLDYKI